MYGRTVLGAILNVKAISIAFFFKVLHCLWAKSNNRIRGQSECDVTWFRFCFDFVRSHARCGCFSIACLRF